MTRGRYQAVSPIPTTVGTAKGGPCHSTALLGHGKVGAQRRRRDLAPGTPKTITHPNPVEGPGLYVPIPDEEWRTDATVLGRNNLRAKYPDTYTAWHCMWFNRRKRGLATVDPAYSSFLGFFADMGPKGAPDRTLDRIDPGDHRYGPGLCKWSDKTEQARNRGNTVFLTDPISATRRPLVEWAEILGVNANTLRGRRRARWTDAEVLSGKRSAKGQCAPSRSDRWPWEVSPEMIGQWEAWYSEAAKRGTEGQRNELRCDFAIRKLAKMIEDIDDWLMETAASWGEYGEDPVTGMPPDIRTHWDNRSCAQVRLARLRQEAVLFRADLRTASPEKRGQLTISNPGHPVARAHS